MKRQVNYKIKQIPEDFLVKEVSNTTALSDGPYILFRLKKKLLSTIEAASILSNRCHVPVKNIGYSGTKDKHAVTEQYCTILGIDEKSFAKMKFPNMTIEVLGHSERPMSLGMHERNAFEIILRNLEESPKPLRKFVNYYGEQRFGNNNAVIGKFLIKQQFNKAVREILLNSPMYHDVLDEYLTHHINDVVGALKRLPQRLVKLYIHAYQSLLWNQIAHMIHPDFPKSNVAVPIIGFGTKNTRMWKPFIDPILSREEISLREFIIPQLPDLSSEGAKRMLIETVKELRIGELEKDDINRGKFKLKISFALSKGSYATVFLHQLCTEFGEYPF